MTGTTHLSMVRNATYRGGFSRSTSLASICPEKWALFFFLPDLILTQRRSSSAPWLHNGGVSHRRDSDWSQYASELVILLVPGAEGVEA